MTNRDNIKAYDMMLQQHVGKKDFIKINRSFKDKEDNIAGFLLSFSKDFLLLQVDDEFSLNGYVVIRKDQFDSLRCNKYDKALKRIYKAEGLLDNQFGIHKDISLTTWQDIFKDLKSFDYHVIVECEDKDEPDFVIGPIKRITKEKVGIQYYDPTGKLENGMTTIKYSDITIVRFGDRYSTTFRKYLKPKK